MDAPETHLTLARHLVDFGLALVVWLVQAVIYPSFRWAADPTFPEWHARYTRAISWFVVPLMFSQALLVSRDALGDPRPAAFVALVLVAAGFLLTFLLAVPQHRVLSAGRSDEAIDRLLRVNRIRAIGWTVVLALGFV